MLSNSLGDSGIIKIVDNEIRTINNFWYNLKSTTLISLSLGEA